MLQTINSQNIGMHYQMENTDKMSLSALESDD